MIHNTMNAQTCDMRNSKLSPTTGLAWWTRKAACHTQLDGDCTATATPTRTHLPKAAQHPSGASSGTGTAGCGLGAIATGGGDASSACKYGGESVSGVCCVCCICVEQKQPNTGRGHTRTHLVERWHTGHIVVRLARFDDDRWRTSSHLRLLLPPSVHSEVCVCGALARSTSATPCFSSARVTRPNVRRSVNPHHQTGSWPKRTEVVGRIGRE